MIETQHEYFPGQSFVQREASSWKPAPSTILAQEQWCSYVSWLSVTGELGICTSDDLVKLLPCMVECAGTSDSIAEGKRDACERQGRAHRHHLFCFRRLCHVV